MSESTQKPHRAAEPPQPAKQAMPPADQADASPINGVVPPVEHRWPPGVSGNPAGRKSAGAYVIEWLNALAEKDLTEQELRAIAKDSKVPWSKRAAAERMVRALESGDLADMEPVLSGEMTLDQLRQAGVNTAIIKKCRRRVRTTKDGQTEEESEIELRDRGGTDLDRILDRTEGRPTQAVALTGAVTVQSVEMRVLGVPSDFKPRD